MIIAGIIISIIIFIASLYVAYCMGFERKTKFYKEMTYGLQFKGALNLYATKGIPVTFEDRMSALHFVRLYNDCLYLRGMVTNGDDWYFNKPLSWSSITNTPHGYEINLPEPESFSKESCNA